MHLLESSIMMSDVMFLSDSDQTSGGKNIYKNSKGNVDTEEIMLNETKANEVWLWYRRLVGCYRCIRQFFTIANVFQG